MRDSDFADFLRDYRLLDSSKAGSGAGDIPGFIRFYCTDEIYEGNNAKVCFKLNIKEEHARDGYPEFECDADRAKASYVDPYIYDPSKAGSPDAIRSWSRMLCGSTYLLTGLATTSVILLSAMAF